MNRLVSLRKLQKRSIVEYLLFIIKSIQQFKTYFLRAS